MSHVILTSLSERQHEETSSIHLHVGEMTVTLDDVVCLLHIPVEWKILSHNKKVSHEIGVVCMTELIGGFEVVVIKEYGTNMTYS